MQIPEGKGDVTGMLITRVNANTDSSELEQFNLNNVGPRVYNSAPGMVMWTSRAFNLIAAGDWKEGAPYT